MIDEATNNWDLFISHASEDKADFVAPLARTLSEFGVRVWYDEFTLKIGDSLSRSIDTGLARSDYGIVVLSPSFIAKRWPEYELRGLVAKEMSGNKTILPIRHKISHEEVLSFSPPLADKFSILTDKKKISEIAVQIIEVIRPDIFTNILRRSVYLDAVAKAKISFVSLEELNPSPIRHAELPSEFIGRVRLVRSALFEVLPHSMEFWLDGFRRDAHPSKEICFWEHLSAAYHECVILLDAQDAPERQKIFNAMLMMGLSGLGCDLGKQTDGFADDDILTLRTSLASALPINDIDDPVEVQDIASVTAEKFHLGKYIDREHFPDIPDRLVREVMGLNS
jgi:hypothetical protein